MAVTKGRQYDAKIAAAIAGGLVGFCIGPVTGSMIGGAIAGQARGAEFAEAGRFIGMGIGLIAGAALGAFLVGRPRVSRWTLGFACALGAIACFAGFAGPILLTPDSPQGPLLGIFVTGPIGFLLGAVIGFAVGVSRSRHSNHGHEIRCMRTLRSQTRVHSGPKISQTQSVHPKSHCSNFPQQPLPALFSPSDE